jgi:hypothetical protein
MFMKDWEGLGSAFLALFLIIHMHRLRDWVGINNGMENLMAFCKGRSDSLRFLVLAMGFETEQTYSRGTALCIETETEETEKKSEGYI